MSTANEVVSRTVHALCAERAISQTELADRMGVKRSTLAHKLTGRRPWHLEDVDRLSAGLDVPVERFFRSTEAVTDWYRSVRRALTGWVTEPVGAAA